MPSRPADFNAALRFTLKWEGGYSNDPDDPGGATNFGITQKTYDGFYKGLGIPVRSVRDISPQDVNDIYRKLYWNGLRCSEMQDPLAGVLFDSAVNCGVSRVVKWLQRNIPGLVVDGALGPLTMAAVAREDAEVLAKKIIAEREEHYLRLCNKNPIFNKYLLGWTNRVESLRTHAGLRSPE